MSRYRDLLVSRENLNWAWKKARWLYRGADGIYDVAEVAAFELELERHLDELAADLSSGSYRLRPIILVPQPKRSLGEPLLRQSFHIAVRDQVAWLAMVNVIGPPLDSQMPPWSYGHRLYKAAWFEEQDGRPHLELGPYRHSGGHLYRRFKHSWPLFRRHISLTARAMVGGLADPEHLDQSERRAYAYSERPAYLNEGHWPARDGTTLYYASLDLEKFYPKTKTSAVLDGICTHLLRDDVDAWLTGLLSRMLDFRVSGTGSDLLGSPVCQPRTKSGKFSGIPTGLMVAGFLSNVAMLRLDRVVARRLGKNNRIAQFRFVDDHAILAYDFDELCAWIRRYSATLDRLAIGPRVSPVKYDPPMLGRILRGRAKPDLVERVAVESRIDGSHPSKLMTKTLALVSELAGAEFDILPDQLKEQRLSELEWLLLADLPDREIRADTRAAFAAGRIATLVPVAFRPSVELLQYRRDLARLQATSPLDPSAIAEAQVGVRYYQSVEWAKYLKRIDHYFKLVFQASKDHPEKPRLFLRVLDYCRKTGQSGTPSVLRWIRDTVSATNRPLAEYLGSLAILAIAKHIVTASFDLSNKRLLARQRRAAARYIYSLSGAKGRAAIQALLEQPRSDDFGRLAARNALLPAVACAAAIVRLRQYKKRVSTLAQAIGAPDLRSSSQTWKEMTGAPIGVWAHWLDGLSIVSTLDPGLVWRKTRRQHDPALPLDWANLRKGVRMFPDRASTHLRRASRKLDQTDAGWLLELYESGSGLSLDGAISRAPAGRLVLQHLRAVGQARDYVTAQEWITSVRTLTPYDPRVGEWTALEIIRQLLESVRRFPEGSLKQLDHLHPSNLLLPMTWLADKPPVQFAQSSWTWEAWRQVARDPARTVKLTRSTIKDYRRHPTAIWPLEPEAWRGRLRAIGLLLLGLVRADFRLPAIWNVRGLERDVTTFVKKELEETALSSRSQAILEASLLPRSAETAIMRLNAWAFFGDPETPRINDTTTDPPDIPDLESLLAEIASAQSILQVKQISVLNHAPRQLIPMNVVQLGGTAVDIVGGDEPE